MLIPPWLRRRREGRPAESILTFHRKLWELERTSIYSDAAYSDAVYSDGYVDDADGVAFDEGGFDADGNPVERGLAGRVDPVGASVAARRVGGPGRGSASAPSSAQRLASRTALRRRRRIFSGLLGGLLTSLAAAALTGTAMAWSVHAAITLLFVTYIALLVRHHQRVVEQVTKVRYISPIRAPRPAVVVLRSGTATGH